MTTSSTGENQDFDGEQELAKAAESATEEAVVEEASGAAKDNIKEDTEEDIKADAKADAKGEDTALEQTSKTTVNTDHEILVDGEAYTNLPQDLFIPPDALEVFLEAFQGPLDLLLYLIRRQKLDILNIPVALITRQYMEYVEVMRHIRLDLAAEYLVMAATLAEIKSRMLLPRQSSDDEADEEDPRAALVRRLQEYERYAKAATDIDEIPRLEREFYLVDAQFNDDSSDVIEATASLDDLVAAFRHVVSRLGDNKRFNITSEGLTVREKMTSVLERVKQQNFMQFSDFFDPEEGRLGLIVSFMAILELVRNNMLIIVQNEAFSEIHIKSITAE